MKTSIKSILILLVCTIASQAVAQTVTIGDAEGLPGETVQVDVSFTAGASPERDVTTIALNIAFAGTYENVEPTGVAAPLCGGDVTPLASELCGWGSPTQPNNYQVQVTKALPFPTAVIARIDFTIPANAVPGVDSFTVPQALIGTTVPLNPPAQIILGQITISKADQAITDFKADPPIGIVGGTSTLSATASSGLAVTFGTLTPTVCGVAGDVVSYLTAGVCTVTADQAGNDSYNPAPQVTLDITGEKVDQTITGFAANPSPGEVNGSSTLSATASSGLAVSFGSNTASVCTVSGSTVSYLTAGVCTVTADQAGDAVYNPASQVTLDITVNKIDQTISGFAANPDPGVVDGTSTLSATASSGLDVTFGSSTAAVCTVSGSTVTYLAAGTCTVTADQAGDDSYNAATQVTLGIVVNKADQTIDGLAADPADGAVGGTSTVSATASSGLAVAYSSSTPTTCTVAGDVVTYVAVGTCTVLADQAGDANYNAAPQVTIDVAVAMGDQVITNFAVDPAQGLLLTDGTLSATGGGSGNPIVFASTTPDTCTVSGNVVSYIEIGTCSVTADQAGDDNWNAAAQATLNISVLSPTTGIPTLSTWGLITMVLAMLGLGGIVSRRRKFN